MHAVERRVRLGEVAALVGAAALLPGDAGGADQPSERVGVAGEFAQAGGVAPQAGEAPERFARGLRRRRGSLRLRREVRLGALLWLVARRQRRAAPEHEALRQRVGSEAVGAVQARGGALPPRVEGGERRAAGEGGPPPPPPVVRGGGPPRRAPR